MPSRIRSNTGSPLASSTGKMSLSKSLICSSYKPASLAGAPVPTRCTFSVGIFTARTQTSSASAAHFPSGVRSFTKNRWTLLQSTPFSSFSPASALATDPPGTARVKYPRSAMAALAFSSTSKHSALFNSSTLSKASTTNSPSISSASEESRGPSSSTSSSSMAAVARATEAAATTEAQQRERLTRPKKAGAAADCNAAAARRALDECATGRRHTAADV
mmetsp:Transcript_6556/g.16295  ORF Transcript_6556/g.16295 Transcript_6556/m.16295 type:complete len:219 (+) Transcript_6556:946-1602(+)